MKKILLGVAVAVAAVMMTGCPGLGINLDGNKYDATMTMDSTNIKETTKIADNSKSYKNKTWADVVSANAANTFYQREWKRLGSLEKAEALTTKITVDLDPAKTVLVNPSDGTRKAVWGFAFDFDTNANGSENVDFFLVGIRQKNAASGGNQAVYEYYCERYLDIPEKYNKANGGSILTDASSLGPYLTTGKSGTVLSNGICEKGEYSTFTNYVGNDTGDSDDWRDLPNGTFAADSAKFETYLRVVQATAGKYEVFLSNTEEGGSKILEFSVTAPKNLERQKTSVNSLFRYGPVSSKGYLMGGIACYASCPYNTKLSVHYDTPKESIQGAIFAQPVE